MLVFFYKYLIQFQWFVFLLVKTVNLLTERPLFTSLRYVGQCLSL
jgi:hypothetical protein